MAGGVVKMLALEGDPLWSELYRVLGELYGEEVFGLVIVGWTKSGCAPGYTAPGVLSSLPVEMDEPRLLVDAIGAVQRAWVQARDDEPSPKLTIA